MNKNQVITYSLLAHINNTSTLSTGLLDLFVPIAKKALAELSHGGIKEGGNILEIKQVIDSLYALDIPLPILKKLLQKIEKEVNTPDNLKLILYQDGAYSIRNYEFDDFEEVVKIKETEIAGLEKLFKKFCEANKIKKIEYSSIFDFINKNKLSIAKYLKNANEKVIDSQTSLLIEAQFIDYFRKVPEVYNTIRNIYLGSIISTYIEYKTETVNVEVELLYDTNFVIGLLDLNTPESSHTCSKLVDLAKSLGYKQSIMETTIEEIRNLLKARAENFDGAYLVRKINREDIYNACERRNLTKTDLQKIADNIDTFLADKGIYTITNTKKYQNVAKFSREFAVMKEYRNSDRAALHDASAIYYVREKRSKLVYSFEEAKCWFVHNSTNSVKVPALGNDQRGAKAMSESIKVDDLLNILWLSTPGFSQALNQDELTEFGLNALISCTLSDALPKAALIRDLDKNINKYVADKTLNELDIIRVATRISNRELIDIEELNKLEQDNPKEFIEKIKHASEEQKATEEERAKKFDALFSEITKTEQLLKNKHSELEKSHQDIRETESALKEKSQKDELEKSKLRDEILRQKQIRLSTENSQRKEKRDKFIEMRLYHWRRNGWIEFAFCMMFMIGCILWYLYSHNWSLKQANDSFKTDKENILVIGILFLGNDFLTYWVIKSLVDKYRNHSNIKAYIERLNIPDEYKDIKGTDLLN